MFINISEKIFGIPPYEESYLATFSQFVIKYSFGTGLPTSNDSMVLLSIYVNWFIIRCHVKWQHYTSLNCYRCYIDDLVNRERFALDHQMITEGKKAC